MYILADIILDPEPFLFFFFFVLALVFSLRSVMGSMYVLLIPYLDLHGSLGGPAGGGAPPPDGTIRDGDGDGDGDGGAEYDRVFWTVVKVPLWSVQ